MEYWGRLQAAGEIEGCDVVLLDVHGGDLGGFFLLKGEREKLARVRASEEMERLLVRANLIVDDLGAVGGFTGEGVARRMPAFGDGAGCLGLWLCWRGALPRPTPTSPRLGSSNRPVSRRRRTRGRTPGRLPSRSWSCGSRDRGCTT